MSVYEKDSRVLLIATLIPRTNYMKY